MIEITDRDGGGPGLCREAPHLNTQARSAALVETYEREGYNAFWRLLTEQMRGGPAVYEGSAFMAEVYLRSRDRAKAIDTLEQGYQERKPNIIYLRANPLYDELRGDPRFEALEKKLDLPAP